MLHAHRAVRHGAAVLAFAGALALVPARPAAAHASLERSEPAASAVLEDPPPRVLLDFDEEVETGTAEIRVLAADGTAVAVGDPSRGDDATQVVTPLPVLDDGAYVVAWRVQSADGHPVNGAFPFQIGLAGADTSTLLQQALRQDEPDPTVAGALDVSRFATYAGLALLIGGALFAVSIWPAAGERRGARALLVTGWAVALAGTVGTFVLTWPYTTAGGLGDALSVDGWREAADTRTGRALLARTLLLVVAGAVLGHLRPTLRRGWRVLAGLGAVALAATVALAGHAGSRRLPVAGVVLDVVHVLAMAAWLGGLAMLVPTLARGRAVPVGHPAGASVAAPPERQEGDLLAASAPAALSRFSRLALVGVLALLVTGVLQAARVLPDPGALSDTDYGRTLIVKVVVVVGLVALGWWSRRLVRAGERGPALWRSVVLEAVLAAGVLAVTASLVSTPPDAQATTEPFTAQLAQGDTVLDISLTPARVGSNELHLTFSPPGGNLTPVVSAEARLLLPEREDLGRIPVPLEFAGPNHWIGSGVQIPYAGDWRLEVVTETTDGVTLQYATPVEIAG